MNIVDLGKGAIGTLLLSLPLLSSPASANETELVARQITADTAEKLIMGGPDAIGGIGDWFISNGTLCAIVSDIDHEGEFSAKGGSLVDLGFCGRDDDHFAASHELLNGSRKQPLNTYKIESKLDDNNAQIVVYGRNAGIGIRTEFSLNQEHPSKLFVTKQVEQIAPEAEKVNFFSSLNFNYHSLEAFVLNSQEPAHNNGFKHEDFVSRGTSAITKAARRADTIVTLAPPTANVGVAYGWQLRKAVRIEDGKQIKLPSFILADDSSNASLILSDEFYIGDGSEIGWVQLPQIPLLKLGENAKIKTEEVIYVGRNGDVAAITDQLFTDHYDSLLKLHGTVNVNTAAIHVFDKQGSPITHIRSDQQGRFAAMLPPGQYTLKAFTTADRQIERDVVLETEAAEVAINFPQAARLSLPQGQAMRLVFVGKNGTPDPDFEDRLTGFSTTDDDGEHFIPAVRDVFLAGVDGDRTSVDLVAGDYLIYATRGPEYSLSKTRLSLKNGESKTLEIDAPQLSNPTPNYIASDLHVHSGFSFDNTFAEQIRVRTFVAEHGEVMVSSEHDVPVDYAPIVADMGLEDKIITIAATEATSLLPTKLNPYTNGHANIFPFTPKPLEYRRGMIAHEDMRWRDVLHQVRSTLPNALVQLNHPRRNLKLSGKELPNDWQDMIDHGQFFEHMGTAGHPYNPHKHIHSHPNNTLVHAHPETGVRDIDFDLLEVVNYSDKDTNNRDRIAAVRLDWLSLLNQGIHMVATANSDSHNAGQQVAVPRTMVAITDDSLTNFDLQEFLDNLKLGRVYGTTGPMLELSLGEAKMGETFVGERGNLAVTISKSDWIDVDTMTIQINGETVDTVELNNELVQQVEVPLEFTKDSQVTIEVFGDAGEDYRHVYPVLDPYAFSNPIFIDYDQDGEWTPPGLPAL